MSSPWTRVPKKAPVSAESLRSSLLQHLNRYGVIVHRDGPEGLTAEEVQAQRDAGVPEDIIEKIYFQEPDPREQKSKASVIQRLTLQDLDRILAEVNSVDKKKEIQGRLTALVGVILTEIAFVAIQRPVGICFELRSALIVLGSGSIQSILSQTIIKLYAQSPSLWLLAGVTSVVGYLIFQDTRRWIGLDSISSVLTNMRKSVACFARVRDSDIRAINSWRWTSVPWKDYMKEIRPEEYKVGGSRS
ncbi:hypothetical protein TWF718_008555 [Orbilia javanica]|uniref:Uncharacterized protein n=1 Tax=Orbilia javanica TaxID=47235 RepID=A0AAN8RD71_9PEZI